MSKAIAQVLSGDAILQAPARRAQSSTSEATNANHIHVWTMPAPQPPPERFHFGSFVLGVLVGALGVGAIVKRG